MVILNVLFSAIFCLLNAIQGLKEWPQSAIIPSVHDVHKSLSSLELKIESEQESEELFKNYNSFTKLTLLENVENNEFTEPQIIDTTHEYNNLVLTTAITFRKERSAPDFKNTQKEDFTEYVKGRRSETQNVKNRYQSLQNFMESEDTTEGEQSVLSELESTEGSTTDNLFRAVLTPARRIYMGHKTKIKHFPFLVTVHVLRRFVCGGSIIKSNLVITAASCLKRWQEWLRRKHITETTIADETSSDEDTTANWLEDNTTETATTETEMPTLAIPTNNSKESNSSSHETPESGLLTVRVGTNYYRLEGKVVVVVRVHFHPSYQEKTLQNNLVIMKLAKHLSFHHPRVHKIDFLMVATELPEGTEVTIAGWGAKTYHNKIYNALWNLIHKAVLTVIDIEQCIETYTSEFVTNGTNFCALSEKNEGACNGDAGDPAVLEGVLVGVTSFGSPRCGAPNATTVFTHLGYYADWINKIMNETPSSSSSEEDSSQSIEETTTKQPECLRNRCPVYYSGEKYREKNNFQVKMIWPRAYRRKFEDKYKETSINEFKLGKENTDSERGSGFLTMSVRPVTSPIQYEYSSGDIGPYKYTSSGTHAKMENNFLLTPYTPGYDTIV